MSRCFPYPPPGYTLSRDSEAALIKSIKLQNERVKDQKIKSERRDKREKRKDKTLRLHNHGEHLNGKLCPDTNRKFIGAETESLERSGLSEEHGLPVTLLLPSSSSDSTENSNNRKRPLSTIACPPRSGKIIRILLSKKQSVTDSLGNEQHPCTTSGQFTEPPCPRKNHQAYERRSQIEASASATVHLETPDEAATKTGAPPLPTSKRHKAHLKYTNLIENWVPSPLQEPNVHSDDGLDWLFKSKDKESCQSRKRHVSISDLKHCSSNSSVGWPRAHLLPDIGVYALPYTVPF